MLATALLVAAYLLLAPWVFVLGPLVVLLLVSRPAARRELILLAVSVPLLAISLLAVGGLFAQFVRAAGVLLTGAFVVLMLWRPGPVFGRALTAIAAAGAGVLIWGSQFGFGWPQVQVEAARDTHAFFQQQATAAAAQGSAGETAQRLFTQLAAGADDVAALFPAILVLGALGGLALAWRVYQQVAEHPLIRSEPAFAAFRFGDQFVWAPVIALAALVLPVGDALNPISIRIVAQNVLLVCVVLYTVRGLAVFWTVARSAPRMIVLVLSLVAIFLSPFAVSGLALLGLADSWVDFRRRLAPPSTGGFSP